MQKFHLFLYFFETAAAGTEADTERFQPELAYVKCLTLGEVFFEVLTLAVRVSAGYWWIGWLAYLRRGCAEIPVPRM